MEAPEDEWMDYSLDSLIAIREELMEGDLRALYIGWLASQDMLEGYRYEEDEDDIDEDYEDDEKPRGTPEVPPAFKKLTSAQRELAKLLQVPSELLMAAAMHSSDPAKQTTSDDFMAWVELLPQKRRSDYLVRLTRNEPGLHLRLVKESCAIGQPNTEVKSTANGDTQ